jgi:NADH dehydrogenase
VQYVSLKEKYVETSQGRIEYDYLVVGLGSTTNFFAVPGAEENCLTLKNLEDAKVIKNRCIELCEQAIHIKDPEVRKKTLRLVIIGGGATGVELAAELIEFFHHTLEKYFCDKNIRRDTEIVLVHRDTELLSMFPVSLRKKSAKILQKKGIKVLLNTEVVRVDHDGVHTKDGKCLATSTPIWTAGVMPTPIHFDEEIKNERGLIPVEQTLNTKDFAEVFVVGDIAGYFDPHTKKSLPSLAQVAVKQASVVAHNIAVSIKNQPLKNFHYKHKGTMVSLGQWMAAGEISRFSFSGHLAWWLWRTIYLSKLISWQKKLKVAGNWTLNLFSPRDISKF